EATPLECGTPVVSGGKRSPSVTALYHAAEAKEDCAMTCTPGGRFGGTQSTRQPERLKVVFEVAWHCPRDLEDPPELDYQQLHCEVTVGAQAPPATASNSAAVRSIRPAGFSGSKARSASGRLLRNSSSFHARMIFSADIVRSFRSCGCEPDGCSSGTRGPRGLDARRRWGPGPAAGVCSIQVEALPHRQGL